ncbi:MAG: AraC family transcriptional regulator [Paracoccus sp. (in: a-proteobacteria)]|uniref:AraC family transcriptional regulator n=1 Tax=Paracoccus sp. TaxID=267 RepID=UPI00391A6D7B
MSADDLGRYGLMAADLSDPYALLPLARYVATFEDLARHLNLPDLGLRVGTNIRAADLGPMGVLFSLSPTLRKGFTRLSAHVRALQGGTQSSVFEVGSDLVWTYRIADLSIWPRRQDAEYTLAAVCQLVRSGFSPGWTPQEIHLEHAEAGHRPLLSRVFRAPVLFGQSANRIVLDAASADRIHRSEDTGLTRILERHIADLTRNAPRPEGVVGQVRQLIGPMLGQRPVTLTALAQELRMSPRSLQRHLAGQGTSLRALLRAHREELAGIQMREGGQRVADIASALGYADGTVLRRAMRSWTAEDGTVPPHTLRRGAPITDE